MKLTITEKDQAQAGPYKDNANCLVSTMLKRKGYTQVSALPCRVFADGKTFDILNNSQIHEKLYNIKRERVLKSAIGKKIELVEV